MRAEHSEFYNRYMQTEVWQDKRLRRYTIDHGRCAMCGKLLEIGSFECHHLHYRRLGHEDIMTDIATLCEHCHKLIHHFYDRPGGFSSSKFNDNENGMRE